MDLSLYVLGSSELEKIILFDLEELFASSIEGKLIPSTLIVGKVFLEATAIRLLTQDLDIIDIIEELKVNRDLISNLFKEKVISLLEKCYKNNGLLDYDESRSVDMLYDPDQEYLSLLCYIRPDHPEFSEDDHFRILSYKPEEILTQIKQKLNFQ